MSDLNTGLDAQLMTLAAIAYAGEKSGETGTEKADISGQLANTDYATRGDWTLLWGPAVVYDDNLIYVAQRDSDKAIAIALRGTVFESVESWWEDFPTELVPAPGEKGCVCNHFLSAAQAMLAAFDPVTGQSFASLLDPMPPRIYVTGHSQGGGIAPIVHALLVAEYGVSATRSQSVTFAAPSPGDATFAAYVDTLKSRRYYNTLDIVPRAYNELSDIWQDGLPVKATVDQDAIRLAADAWTETTGLKPADFAQPERDVTALNTDGRTMPGKSPSYFERVEAQHTHNSYLVFMNAHQTTVLAPSPFAPKPAA